MLQAGLSQERSVLTATCLPPVSRGGVWLLYRILTCLNLCKDVFPVAFWTSLNFLFWHSRLLVIDPPSASLSPVVLKPALA